MLPANSAAKRTVTRITALTVSTYGLHASSASTASGCSDSPFTTSFGDGLQVRDYLFIDDAVRGLTMVATEGASGEEYNVASGEPVRLLDLARLIAELMGYPDIRITPTGRSFAGDTARWYADISKVRRLGFEPRVDLRSGLERTIAWLMTRPVSASVPA
jgi:nucleoside-diphosphate-sugar epimerase